MTNARRALRDYERSLNMSSNSSATASASGGIGVFGLAFLVLLVFKLAGLAGASWGLANLSWWIVFSPLLIGFGIAIFFLIIFFLLLVIFDR